MTTSTEPGVDHRARHPRDNVRPWSVAARAAGGTALVVAVVTLAVHGPLATRVATQEPLPLIGRPLPDFGPATPDELVARALMVLAALAVIAAGAAARWPGGWRRAVLSPASATDLAVVRIGVFGLALVLPRVPEAVRLSGFPAELRVPPAVMPWLLDVVPTSPTTVRPLAVVFLVACALACVGLWTRPAMVVAAVVGLYLLGIPQFHGKVSHYHHLWWAMAVLAASPAGHAVSFDAVRRGWRTPDGVRSRELHGVAYGAPLRVLWLLMGLVYLFPGLWKFASAGWQWALSDNLRFVLYEHWARIGTSPALPIDRSPLLEIAGVTTIVFELLFVVLILHRRTRPWTAAFGLLFHNANLVLLGLGFFTLQVLYLSFVPWGRVAAAIGARRRPLHVTVAADAPRARRLVGAADGADPFGRSTVEVVEGAPEALRTDRDRSAGAAATRLVARSPLLWPAWPVLRAASGGRVERRLRGGRPPAAPATPAAVGATSAVLVGGLLLVGNVGVGLLAISAAWPVASYPSFAGIHPDTVTRLSLELTAPDGEQRLWTSEELRDLISWEKYDALARPLLSDEPDPARVAGLLEVLRDEGGEVPAGGQVTLLRDRERLTRDGPQLAERDELATLPLPG